MKNVPSPFIQYDNNLSVVVPNEPVRNALMLSLKVKLIRARNVNEDVDDLKNNVVCDGHSLLIDIKNVACKCNVLDKYFCMLIHNECRD